MMSDTGIVCQPFLLKFGERMSNASEPSLGYDAQRQVLSAFVNGRWRELVEVQPDMIHGVTRKTGIERETTDDD